jgi:hypothetical protein
MALRVGWARMKQQIILSALLATSALSLMAQDADSAAPRGGRPPGGRGGPGHRPPPFVAALDANKDGVIDATELANASTVLAKLDKNGDGQITVDELRPPRPAEAPEPAADGPKRPVPPLVATLDADGDGSISAVELANASASLAKLDKNNDGQLTPEEFMGGRGPRGGRGPGGPGRGPRPNAPQE